jgi:hypothetical protein
MNPKPEPGQAATLALQQIDQILAKKPEKDDHALTEATKALCALRDDLIAARRAGDDAGRQRLETVNAVLSIVAATHFPVGEVPWEPLASARGALAELAAIKSLSIP